MSAASQAERAADVVRALAREPRPAGSEAESQARQYCAERLRAAGFDVREEPFGYSSFIGRWGTPIGGVATLAILLSASYLARDGRPVAALTLLVVGGIALAVAALGAARSGVLTFPAERRRGVNLVAIRGGAEPPLWLMAHLDSKSQPVPILARAAGITLLAATWIASAAAAALQLDGGPPTPAVWGSIALVAFVGAVPVIATTVGNRSPGALDNASGVAAVLTAAEAIAATASPVGVCLTSAEELGLAGARAWVRGRPAGIAVNCDGVDDDGTVTCMHSGRPPGALIAHVIDAAARSGVAVRSQRLLPGVLTDGVALADAGWSVVTLSKGGVRTLARIHTPRDRADSITGVGIAQVAQVIVNLAE